MNLPAGGQFGQNLLIVFNGFYENLIHARNNFMKHVDVHFWNEVLQSLIGGGAGLQAYLHRMPVIIRGIAQDLERLRTIKA